MKQTIFIDTSVLCNLLSVPGKNQQEEEMKGKFKNLQKTGGDLHPSTNNGGGDWKPYSSGQAGRFT